MEPSTGDVDIASDDSWTGSYALPNSARSPALARVLVGQALAGCPQQLVDTARLLVSELVTNAVRHADSMVVLSIAATGRGWRLSVEDLSADPPEPQDAGLDGVGGRGLQLVIALATQWGWERTPTGKRVWFEL